MATPVRVLIVEDQAEDAEMEAKRLRQAGFDIEWTRVDTTDAFLSHLDASVDLILFDSSVPGFGNEKALKLLKQSGLDIPLIIVTGTLGAEKAVDLIKAGATDFVLKNNLTRLSEAVRQALANKELRSAKDQAETALQESEERFRTIVETIPGTVVAIGADGQMVMVNPKVSDTFGYQPDELIGQPVEMLLPERFHKGHSIFRESYFENPSPRAMGVGRDLAGLHKDGTEFPVEIGLSFTQTRDGPLALAFIIDITERKQAEAQILKLNSDLEAHVTERTAELQAANEELESFSYSVSHDLRAPLRAIDGYSGMLFQEYADHLPDEARRYVDVIRRNVEQMGQLIDDLLQFSRTGRAPLESQTVNMDDLVKLVLLGLQGEQEGRMLKVAVGKLPSAEGDRALLIQVWQNLIANALKFTRKREDARIDIGSKQVKGQVIYLVKDNGAGFDMAYADNLFGVFQRLHRAEDFEGTGVGLATVKRIIQRHGGRIWVEAEEDKGATFYFTVGGEAKNG